MSGRKNIEPYMWKKGKSGNPGGRRRMSEDTKKALKLSIEQFISDVTEMWLMSAEDLIEIAQDQTEKAGRIYVARVILNGMRTGCPQRLNVLMDRVFGKPLDMIKFEGIFNEQVPQSNLVELMNNPKYRDMILELAEASEKINGRNTEPSMEDVSTHSSEESK